MLNAALRRYAAFLLAWSQHIEDGGQLSFEEFTLGEFSGELQLPADDVFEEMQSVR